MRIEADNNKVKVIITKKDGSEYHISVMNEDISLELFDKDGKEINSAIYYHENLCPVVRD